MLKYPCLVLDHDDTVVQSMKTLSYPFFCYGLSLFRPGASMTLEKYIFECHNMGFLELCRHYFQFTDEELAQENQMWTEYLRSHTPDAFPGIDKVIHRHKEAGGLLCVVSHSAIENITRDYQTHFGILPDAIYGWDLPPSQRKPNPYPLLDIMEKYHLQPEDILVVDDMKLACQMSHPLGISVAYAGWNGLEVPQVASEMRSLCDFSFDCIMDLEAFLFPECQKQPFFQKGLLSS